MNSLITIIVPIYNAENTLSRCIDSILNQTYRSWELFLIDDGSTDQSGKLCDDYALKDKRIKVIHKANGGVSSARNLGLQHTKGKWITFVDADDYLNVESLHNMIIGSENSDLVLSSIKLCGLQENVVKIDNVFSLNVHETGNLLTSLNGYMGLTVPFAKLLKSAIINKHQIRFDCRFSSGEDTLFMYQYLYHTKKIRCIDAISYNYVLSNGLSRKMLSLDSIDVILQEIIKALKNLQVRFNFDIKRRYYDSIEYFVTKYDFTNKNIKLYYNDFLYISKRKYFKDMIKDKTYICKGFKRRFLDKLFMYRFYGIIVLWTFKIKKIYL